MLDVNRLKREARERDLVFPLTYHCDDGAREIDVFMVRHRDPLNGDDFTVHEAETGRWLGAGDSKEDAKIDASIRLHQHYDFGITLPPVPREEPSR